jgi:hypothetical protein
MDTIVAIFLSNTIAVAAIGFLLKLWIDKRLSHSFNLEIEKFKSELAKELARYSTQQKWVNDKRMELLCKLHELVIEMDFELKTLFMNVKVQSQTFTADRAIKFCEKYTELNAVLRKNALFFSDEFSAKTLNAYKLYFEIAMECIAGVGDFTEKLRTALPPTLEGVTNVADQPRLEVVNAFRKLAGVDA